MFNQTQLGNHIYPPQMVKQDYLRRPLMAKRRRLPHQFAEQLKVFGPPPVDLHV